MPDIPPWLTRDYNPVETYMRSFAAGAQIGEAQSRLAEEQRQANMHAMAQRESLQANILRAQVELDTQKAYHDQQLALRQQELQQEKERAQMTAEKAANDLAERQAYHNILAEARQREVAVKENAAMGGEASVVEHPEVPGIKFLRNPSGAESVIERPGKGITEESRDKFLLSAARALAPMGSESVTDPSYQMRTNIAHVLLNKYQRSPSPSSTNEVTRFTKDGRRAIFDADTKKFLRYADK